MKVKTIPSKWIENEGYRLDCGPYMLGAIEARELLRKHQTTPLKHLTSGYNGGIYNGPQFVRNYVQDPSHGVPFLTTSSMLQADMSTLPLLSKKDAHSSKLRFLEIKEGMTLITCSGSIGRMVYSRKDMVGIWSNQDIIKVVADQEKILPGYLYAYLSSRFGIPLVISGTYGAIVQHIEPAHIADLPVPRLGELEKRAHELIQQAADEISEHSRLINDATTLLFEKAGLEESKDHLYIADNRNLGWVESKLDSFSLRSLNYDPRSRELWDKITEIPHNHLGDIIDRERFEGYIVFKRIDCEPEYGVMLIGQRDAFQIRPNGRWISKKSIKDLGLLVPPGTTVISCHGSMGDSNFYCRSALVTKRSSQYAFSGDFYRCIPQEGIVASGYLYAFLRSRLAFRMLRSISTGSAQQYLLPKLMEKLPIPRLDTEVEEVIATMVNQAVCLLDHAVDLEDKARMLVEKAIEEAAQ